MHGAGNDFAVIDLREWPASLDAAAIRVLADRHLGIGFDQLLGVGPAHDAAAAWRYAIWNADGSPSGQCGNGARCVAAWLYRAGHLDLDVETPLQSPAGLIGVRLLDASRVAVAMGEPVFTPAAIPFVTDADAAVHAVEIDGQRLEIGAVSMGNPHAVVEVETLDESRLARFGPALSRHPRFPEGCNAGFVERVSEHEIRLRVHERGSGWTLACGTGACAAVAVLARRGRVGPEVDVHLPGGTLHIAWRGPGHVLWMTGPAAFAYTGEVDADILRLS